MKIPDKATQFDFWVRATIANLLEAIRAGYSGRHRPVARHRALTA